MHCLETQPSVSPAITTADGNVFRSGTRGWTVPATFSAQPVINITVDSEGCWWGRASGAGGALSTTAVDYYIYRATSGTPSNIEIELEANGTWY
jgi:hypothetical protein